MEPPPPMGCVSGCTYPSGLLVDRAPSAPMGDVTTPERPKAPKVLLGLSEQPKTSYTYENSTWAIWERQGAPKRSKRNFAILTPQNTQKRRTPMPKRENDFL